MEVDWSAGIPACMSAKHENAWRPRIISVTTPLNYAALQAGMPAVQSITCEWWMVNGELLDSQDSQDKERDERIRQSQALDRR